MTDFTEEKFNFREFFADNINNPEVVKTKGYNNDIILEAWDDNGKYARIRLVFRTD